MAAVDEDAAIDGAFEAFVGMLPQTGKYASLLQQRLAEAQGEEDDEENSSAAESSDQEGAERAANDCSSEDESASNVESVGDGASASGASDDDEAEGDADAEDDANSAEHVHDVFQRLYWGVGAAGGDDPEEDEFIEQLGEAKKLEARSIPLTAEQLGLGDTPEGHQTPFLQVTAKLPTLPDTSTAPFMAPSSSAPAAGSSRKRRRSTPAADSAVTCVDLSAAYNVGAKTAHQFALYHADRHLALKRAGEPVTDAALRGFDEQLTVRQGPEAKEARQAAFAAAVQAAAAAAKPHPLQPRTLASALLSPLQRLVLDNAHDYRDMVLPIESPGNMAQIRTSLALHVASHLQRTRNRVIKHDSKLRSAAAARRVKKLASAVDSVKPEGTQGGAAKPLGAADATDAGQGAADDVQEEEIDADALRDQGFARCRVVVLLPFKHMALQFVRCLLTLLGQGRTVHHRKRFMEEFGDDEAKRGQPAHVQNTVGEADWVEDDFSSERLGAEAAAAAAKKARKGKDKPPPKRPSEHNQQFAGDVDDSFRVGLSIAKNSIRLYSSFYVSDIIIASPMGLRMTTGAEGEADREVDFLSSVEMLVMMHTNTLEMQNWEHVREVVGAMNHLPTKPRDTDFSRVRMWNLAGLSKYRRQTIVCCEHSTPDIAAFTREHMHNARGRALLHWQYAGSLGCVIPSVKQVWHRLDLSKATKVMDKRSKYLARHVVPQLQAGATEDMPSQPHTLVVTPSYFEFVKLRNMMERSGMDFAPISEYSSQQDVSRARTLLFQGRVPQILITERFHFFNRYKLRGIRHIVFAGIPVHGRYYSEFVNFLEEASQSHATSVLVLFTRYEAAALERVVGTARVARLLNTEGKSTFVFC